MSTATRRPKRASFRCRRCKCWFGYRHTCQECGIARGRVARRVGQLRLRVVY